jgi:hypothetical protein
MNSYFLLHAVVDTQLTCTQYTVQTLCWQLMQENFNLSKELDILTL